MKLQSLEIQAFGPFAKKEVINFSALGENPLFLIDGPTGAGKSSILHAICYALYGETTDSDRKEL
jgi:exonuclease SbcC